MPRSKEISEDLRKRGVDAHRSGKGDKTISKDAGLHQSTVMQRVHKWRKLHTIVTPSRSGHPMKITPRGRGTIIQEVTKNPRVTFKDLQASHVLANVSVRESTIRKTLSKNGVHRRIPRRRALLSKKNIDTCLKFAKDHLDDLEGYWKNVLWTDESKVDLFGLNEKCYVYRKPNTVFHHKDLVPTVKHGGGSIMVWGCFAVSGPWRLAILEGTMNSGLYQQILQENVRASFREQKLNRKWVTQQDNNPKHTSKSTTEWLNQKRFYVLEWPRQSPDLNANEMLWSNLKRAVHANISELNRLCEEEWDQNPPSRCAGLIKSSRKRLVEVAAPQGGATSEGSQTCSDKEIECWIILL
uniref:Transposase n=1 Tax=Eptatretus burgeri TaxID=7764 RepID=A0A8C4N7K6_EPTBU